MNNEMTKERGEIEQIHTIVKQTYEKVAEKGKSNLCCRAYNIYTPEELEGIPQLVIDLSSGCDSPISGINFREGERVVDIGCGGGIDLFIAAKHVGKEGQVIGIDASETMIENIKKSLIETKFKDIIEVRKGDATNIPIEDNFADVVISNCVISMFPDKEQVYSEVFRILKPEGRIVISDIISEEKLPDSILKNSEAWAECLVGITEEEYLDFIKQAGFIEISLISKSNVPFPEGREILALKVTAQKPKKFHLEIHEENTIEKEVKEDNNKKILNWGKNPSKNKEKLDTKKYNIRSIKPTDKKATDSGCGCGPGVC